MSALSSINIFVGNYHDSVADALSCSLATSPIWTTTPMENGCNIRSALLFCFESLTALISNTPSLLSSSYVRQDGSMLEDVVYLEGCNLILGISSQHYVTLLSSETDLLSSTLNSFLTTAFSAFSSSSLPSYFLSSLTISSAMSGESAIIIGSSTNMRFLACDGSTLITGSKNSNFLMKFALQNLQISAFGSSSLSSNLYGGAIYLSSVFDSTFENITFSDNAGGRGGAIYLDECSNIQLTNIVAKNNRALEYGGGGIFFGSNNRYININGAHLSHNTAKSYGGGISFEQDNTYIYITSSEVNGNSAILDGGGIFLNQDNMYIYISHSDINGNSADSSGGGLYVSQSNRNINIADSNISCNSAYSGGGVYLSQSNGVINITSTSISSNSAYYGIGGGLHIDESNSDIRITSCSISHNTASQAGGMFLGQSNTGMYITDTDISGNSASGAVGGGGLYASQSNSGIYIVDSRINGNNALGGGGGGIYMNEGNSDIYVVRCNVSLNNAPVGYGGGMYFYRSNSVIHVTGSSIKRNIANNGGAAVFTTENNNLHFQSSVFAHNSASWNGAGIYVYNGNYDLFWGNCEFVYNSAGGSGGGLFIGTTNYNIFLQNNTLFSENTALAAGGAVAMFQGNYAVQIYLSTFVINSASYGGSIYIGLQNTDIVLNSLTFSSNVALSGGGGALYVDVCNTNITVFNASFSNNTASPYGGAVSLKSQNYAIIFDMCDFIRNLALMSGGAMNLYTLNGQFSDVLVGGILSGTGTADPIKMTSCSFTSNVAQAGSGGAVHCDSQNRVVLQHSEFLGNQAASYGGAVDLTSDSVLDSTSVLFKDNRALSYGGGAVAARGGSTLRLYGSSIVFWRNSGHIAGGGAILLSTASTLALHNSNCSFIGNTVSFGGAAIDLGTSNYLTADGHSSLTFVENRVYDMGAPFYWIDTNGDGLTFFEEPSSLSVTWINNTTPFAEQWSTQVTRFVVQYTEINITSYEAATNLNQTLYATDRFGVTNVTYSGPAAPTVSASVTSSNCGGKAGYLTGTVSVSWAAGVATFDSINAYCYPSGNMTVSFTAKIEGLPVYYSVTNTSLFFFRDCIDGEILKDNICHACEDNTYSFFYDPSTTSCTACPDNADGCYLNKINITAGYWRISPFTTSFLECPYGSDACVGGVDSFGMEGSCNAGYEGPLCGVCSMNYYLSTDQCLPCSGTGGSAQLVIFILVPLLLFGLVAVFVLFMSQSMTGVDSLSMVLTGHETAVDLLKEEIQRRTQSRHMPAGQGDRAADAGTAGRTNVCNLDDEASVPMAYDLEASQHSGRSSILGGGAVVPIGDGENQSTMAAQSNPMVTVADSSSNRVKQERAAAAITENDQVTLVEQKSAATKTTAGPKRTSYCLSLYTWAKHQMNKSVPKIKILIAVFQIVSALPFSLQISFPSGANKMFSVFSFANFSGLLLGSPQCQMQRRFDYIDKLLVETLTPLAFSAVIFLSMGIHLLVVRTTAKNKSSLHKSTQAITNRYISLFLLLLYLVLPSVTTTIAGTVPTINVDPSGIYPDQNLYFMVNDLSISKESSRYKLGIIWVAIMAVIYPVGIPALYFFVLYLNREDIQKSKEKKDSAATVAEEGHLTASSRPIDRELNDPASFFEEGKRDLTASSLQILLQQDLSVKAPIKQEGGGEDRVKVRGAFAKIVTADSIRFLYISYEPKYWYWEVVETVRRLLLTAVLSVVGTGTPVQIVFGIVIAVLFMKLYGFYSPYEDIDDDVLQELAQYQIFVTLFVALLIQSDLLPGTAWSTALDVVLVFVNVIAMVVALLMMPEVKERVGDVQTLSNFLVSKVNAITKFCWRKVTGAIYQIPQVACDEIVNNTSSPFGSTDNPRIQKVSVVEETGIAVL